MALSGQSELSLKYLSSFFIRQTKLNILRLVFFDLHIQVMRVEGGSYNARSFLRSCLLLTSKEAGQVMLAYPRGTGAGDIKVVLQEVPTGRIVQELGLGKPVLDIKTASINNIQYLAILGETELSMYRMET